MAAVTENKLVRKADGNRVNYPVAASTRLYQGTLAFVTAAGYADDDTSTGANRFAGVVVEDTDNSSGAAGDKKADVYAEGVFQFEGSGFVQADVGKDAYGIDNFTVQTAYTAAGVRCGRIVEFISSTKVMVKIEVDTQKSLEYTAVAASAAISNTTTETAFDKSHSIPANSLRVGDVIRVLAQMIATATNGTDTLNLKLRLGGTTILATGAVDVANNDLGYIEADIVVRTIGAGGTMVAAGATALGAEGTVTSKPGKLASSALDTTAANVVDVTATWSVANAGNSVRLDVLDVEIIRKR